MRDKSHSFPRFVSRERSFSSEQEIRFSKFRRYARSRNELKCFQSSLGNAGKRRKSSEVKGKKAPSLKNVNNPIWTVRVKENAWRTLGNGKMPVHEISRWIVR